MAENKGDAAENQITIKLECSIVGYYDSVIQITMKKTSKFKKMMFVYRERMGFDMLTLRFRFGGESISEMDTPSSLGMEDGSVIDVCLAQGGPNDFNSYFYYLM